MTPPPSQPPKARKRVAPAANNDARISHCFNGPGPCRRSDELSMMPRCPWQLKRSKWAGPARLGGREGLVSVDSSRHGRERGSEAEKETRRAREQGLAPRSHQIGTDDTTTIPALLISLHKAKADRRDLCKPAASPPAPKLILFLRRQTVSLLFFTYIRHFAVLAALVGRLAILRGFLTTKLSGGA
ncbi:hypothetical protein HDV63DRAFT_400232 [Trichoderma sp. SZMC 28014]